MAKFLLVVFSALFAAAAAAQVPAVSAGADYSFAVSTDGRLHGWGNNDQGQVGDGTRLPRLTPVFAAGGFVAVGAGDKHTVALKGDGSVWSWGDNTHGQLGDGSTTSRQVTAQVATGPFQAICA